MFASLRTRLWLTYVGQIVLALSMVFLLLWVALLRSPFLYRDTLERVRLTAKLAEARYGETSASSYQGILQKISARTNVRLLIERNGQIVWDAWPQAEALVLPPHLMPERTTLLRDARKRVWMVSVQPLAEDIWVIAAAPRPSLLQMTNLWSDLLRPFLLVGLLSLLLSLGVAWLVARSVADPLQGMLSAARHFPDTMPPPVEVRGPHEVREVIQAFNDMAARVQASQQAQQAFVANVSHELKTPLTSIQGFSQALLDGTAEDPAAARQAAEVIHAEAARMHRLALDLLDLARMDAGIAHFERQPVDLALVLHDVVERLRPQIAEAQVEVEIKSEPLPLVLGDGDRLAQVFLNLLDNALRYTPAGGKIWIQAAAETDWVVVRIQDTGSGIPPQALPHLFERFYRADPSRRRAKDQGAGLGLAIAHDIVQAHGGKMGVRNAPEKGAIFEIRLPR